MKKQLYLWVSIVCFGSVLGLIAKASGVPLVMAIILPAIGGGALAGYLMERMMERTMERTDEQ